MNSLSRRGLGRGLIASLAAAGTASWAVSPARADGRPIPYSDNELIESGHHFFGSLSRGLAEAIQSATKKWGQPNAYVLGQEAGGAFVGGLRYGEGAMYTRNAGDRKVYWQGPSLGLDYGADGDRTMMLVYNLPSTDAMFQRFVGVDGSAYLVGGFGVTALTINGVTVVPIRTGVGARLGVNIGYLKFTDAPTWNPF
ncbi:DUF1134 domain-containing protein [Rhodoblastus sp.]|uniref:DUF1134 domain-containing protein n=1 Tax=Rhodoblastus sp. TaxID=1962975 RepID=UPI0035ADAE8B